jgi:hypothetical protein
LCLALLLPAPGALAQRNPHIGYIYPAGGRQDTTLQITVGGQYLDGVSRAYVSGDGVGATVVEHVKPLTPKQANELRGKLRELQKKKGDPEAAKEIAELRKKLATFSRDANPVIAEKVTLRVTIASDAAPGARELRLGTSLGLSNPLIFCVGQLPEFCEKEPNQDVAEPNMVIALPAVVNGQVLPGDVDRFPFRARRGQRLVVVADARALIPYLADAVPGWFQATLSLYDADGNELAYADDYRFYPDPVLSCDIPRDGAYVLEIKDAIYRGREDFVYRIALGELPFVTSIFPLGGSVGARTTIKIEGWNLPTDTLKLDMEGIKRGMRPVFVRGDRQISNCVPFVADALPECVEKEPNDELSGAAPVTLPLIVNGRIDRPGDRDVFCFEGHAGDEVVAEVYARRLDSPVDSLLRLTDAIGRPLAANDDHEDKGAGLTTHHADSLLSTTLPADGTYYLHASDAQGKGGPDYGYRLRISPPQPDFELRVVPSSVNARAGATVRITVYALRKDGFSGDITVRLRDAPRGFILSGGPVPGPQEQVSLRLKVPPTPRKEPVSLYVEGRAVIGGRQVVRPAVPADDMMQAFFYRHLVPAEDFQVAVIRRARPRAASRGRSPATRKSSPAGQPKSGSR